jgi:hypothetical protein
MLEERKQQGLNFDAIYFALLGYHRVSCCFVTAVSRGVYVGGEEKQQGLNFDVIYFALL